LKRVIISTGFLTFALMLPTLAGSAQPAHVANSDQPRDGRHVLEMATVWHRGHDADDLIFGSVNNVQVGPDGGIYVLDQQQSQVCVFDDGGELLRTLSREGEGPGESRQPEDMVFLPDGSLGLAQYINGRIVRIDLKGTPLKMLMPPGYDPQGGGGGLVSIRRARCRGGSFVINGVKVSPQDDGVIRTQYLVRCNEQAEPVVEYLSRSTSSNLQRDGWIEKNHYFPSHERWDIDAQGRVLAACDRNEYRITVFEPDGTAAFTFGRDHEPWRRTGQEKQEIRDSLVVLADGVRVQIEVQVEDMAPVIAAVHAMSDGETWVLTTRNMKNQPDGIMQTYDVFDSGGIFVRQEAVACGGEADEDRLIFLDEDRAALVRGAVQARRNTFGGSRTEEDQEVAVHDLMILAF